MKQPDGLVNGHPPAAFFRLAVSFVSCVHVFLREVAAQEIKVGRVHSDKPRIQHVLYLHTEMEVLQELRCTFKIKRWYPYAHLLPYEDKLICQGHDSKHREGKNSTGTSLMITECYLTIFQKCYNGSPSKVNNSYLLALIRKVISIHEAAPFGGVAM